MVTTVEAEQGMGETSAGGMMGSDQSKKAYASSSGACPGDVIRELIWSALGDVSISKGEVSESYGIHSILGINSISLGGWGDGTGGYGEPRGKGAGNGKERR